MNTSIATLFIAALASGTIVSTATQQSATPEPLTASQVRLLIASAQPEDHERLRGHFEALATKYDADAARHTAMARVAGTDPNRRSGGDPSAHHTRLAALAKESAAITRELATHHGTLAKGAASTAPRGSERFERGAGAATMPSETQLRELAAKARTPAEDGELAEDYQRLAKQDWPTRRNIPRRPRPTAEPNPGPAWRRTAIAS